MRSARVVSLVLVWTLAGCFSETTSSSLAPGSGSAETTHDVFLEAIAPSASFEMDSSEPGATTGFRVLFLVPTGVREPQQLVITAPAAFGFNGFDALGPGAMIGRWEFDFFNPDGVFDDPPGFTIEHFALDANKAYSDSDVSGTQTPTDPTASHELGTGGEHVITVALPFGGDGDPGNNFSRFDTDIRYTLLDGIVVNPSAAGSYTISFQATSIDLDTGGPSDGMGDEPLDFSQQVLVRVPEPARDLLGATLLALLGLLARTRARSGTAPP
jgi:hypothetical protein